MADQKSIPGVPDMKNFEISYSFVAKGFDIRNAKAVVQALDEKGARERAAVVLGEKGHPFKITGCQPW